MIHTHPTGHKISTNSHNNLFSLTKLLKLGAKENKVIFFVYINLESILLIEDINEAVSVDEQEGDSNNIVGNEKIHGSLKQFSLNSSVASLNAINKPPVMKKT